MLYQIKTLSLSKHTSTWKVKRNNMSTILRTCASISNEDGGRQTCKSVTSDLPLHRKPILGKKLSMVNAKINSERALLSLDSSTFLENRPGKAAQKGKG